MYSFVVMGGADQQPARGGWFGNSHEGLCCCCGHQVSEWAAGWHDVLGLWVCLWLWLAMHICFCTLLLVLILRPFALV